MHDRSPVIRWEGVNSEISPSEQGNGEVRNLSVS